MSQNKDRFFRLKYMGYCMSQLPPEGIESTLEDFLEYARFQLCKVSNRLMKDPIWDTYSDEEILVEYYATLYANNKEERTRIEAVFAGQNQDVVDWFDEMIEKNQAEIKAYKEKLEETEEISFSPTTLGE